MKISKVYALLTRVNIDENYEILGVYRSEESAIKHLRDLRLSQCSLEANGHCRIIHEFYSEEMMMYDVIYDLIYDHSDDRKERMQYEYHIKETTLID